MGLRLWVVLGLAVSAIAQTTRPVEDPKAVLTSNGLLYRVKVSNTPRPFRVHSLRVDLGLNRVEPVVLIAPDPDGRGPAEATLTLPQTLALRAGGDILALVNTNPFRGLPDASGHRSHSWHIGMPVDIGGLAVSWGTVRSEAVGEYQSVWFDSSNRIHIGIPGKDSQVREGLAGFRSILRGKNVLDKPGGPMHPRTALGTDPSGNVLWLVVVDGRQKGFSEGVTLEELAKVMLDLGCTEAVNLDGGGSSVMMLADPKGGLVVANSPSDRVEGRISVRPVPIAFALRKKICLSQPAR